MSNMSYCRFELTLADLRECDEELSASFGITDHMSEREQRACRMMLQLCREMADNYGEADSQ